MTDPRFQRVKEHLARARGLGPGDRRTFLESLRAEDAALHAEVTALLAQEADGPSLVATGALAAELDAAVVAAVAGPAAVPERLGPYRILEVLGEGGMGVVYRAEQDAPLRREVAVKVLRRSVDSDRAVARFDAERQALALMDHPGIARLLDAGADESGRPYLAMELVHGTRITTYCDAHRLVVRQRLGLFLGVCDAVQHVHQRGVIHRDLKPANVLIADVDGAPAAKVIDFGIAKALAAPLEPGREVTEVLGTPEYMSPEQAGAPGAAVDMRSDVYSLGVVLYELLTGAHPYRVGTPRPHEVNRALLGAELVRPSVRAARLAPHTPLAAAHGGPEHVRRQLAGDLDLILLRALRKDAARRYGSVDQLAADLRRLLAGRPKSARPDALRSCAARYVALPSRGGRRHGRTGFPVACEGSSGRVTPRARPDRSPPGGSPRPSPPRPAGRAGASRRRRSPVPARLRR